MWIGCDRAANVGKASWVLFASLLLGTAACESGSEGDSAGIACWLEQSTCSPEATRREMHCGEPGFSAPDCCDRTECDTDDECSGGRCLPGVVQAPFNAGRVYRCTHENGDGCTCAWYTNLIPPSGAGSCVGPEEDVTIFECDTAARPCDFLLGWQQSLTSVLEPENGQAPAGELLVRIESCRAKVAAELTARCD